MKHYSGNNSKAIWDRINKIKNERKRNSLTRICTRLGKSEKFLIDKLIVAEENNDKFTYQRY